MTAASRAVGASAFAALVLAAVWFMWPVNLGGGTVYVVTHGISMEPRFHTGDLGVLRAADHYGVGDVVGYTSRTLKTTVMHRIVALDGNRFVIQGDNNSWLDLDRPTKDLVLGKLWFRVPQGGKALGLLQSPGTLAAAGLAGTVVFGAVQRPRRRRRRQRQPRPAPPWSLPMRALARQATLASGAVALLAATAGGVLLAMPATQSDSSTVPVTQEGHYTYTGTALRGTTYPTGRILTGDTVYTKLTGDLTVVLRDTVSAAGLTGLHGSLRLAVSIAAPDGWSADVGRGAAVPLAGGGSTASVVVQPGPAAELLARHYAEVGATGNDATLSVRAQVEAAGTVSGQPISVSPLPALSFGLNPTALRLSGDPKTVLRPVASSSVTVQQNSPRHFPVLGHSVPLGVARVAVTVVLAVSLLVLAVAAWIGRSRAGDDPADDILMRNAARILPVTRFTPGQTIIDVSDAAALHRVAERLDSLVLHRAGPDDHVFAVQDVETTYRFVLPIAQDGPTTRMEPVASRSAASRRRPPVPAAGLRSVPVHDRAARLRPVPLDGPTTRLRPVRLGDDTARISRVRRLVPVPPVRPLDDLA